jgi:hypothetical protein
MLRRLVVQSFAKKKQQIRARSESVHPPPKIGRAFVPELLQEMISKMLSVRAEGAGSSDP